MHISKESIPIKNTGTQILEKKLQKKTQKREKKKKKKQKIKKRGGIKYRNGSFPSSSYEAHHHIFFQRKALQFFNFSLEKKRKLL